MSSFYEVGPSRIEAGSVVWIPALYPNKDRLILDPNVKADPTEQNLEAILRPLSQRSVHIPIKSLNLPSNEFYFAVRGKIRPAVVLAGGQSKWATSPTEQLFICAPLFTVDKPVFTQSFVLNVQALRHRGMFYIPESHMHHIEESVCRFDAIQVAHGTATEPVLAGKDPVMLSIEFFGLLKSQLILYLGGKLPDDAAEILQMYSELIIDEAKSLGVKFS